MCDRIIDSIYPAYFSLMNPKDKEGPVYCSVRIPEFFRYPDADTDLTLGLGNPGRFLAANLLI